MHTVHTSFHAYKPTVAWDVFASSYRFARRTNTSATAATTRNKNSNSKSHVFQAKFCPPVLWHHAIPCQAIFRQQPSAGCGRKKGPGWCAGVGKTYSSSLILVSIHCGDVRLKLYLLAEVFETLLFQYVSTYLQTCGIHLILMPPWLSVHLTTHLNDGFLDVSPRPKGRYLIRKKGRQASTKVP